MADSDTLATLRSLASEKGYRLDKALIGSCWYLVSEASGQRALSDHGASVFTVERAIKFLSKVEGRPAVS